MNQHKRTPSPFCFSLKRFSTTGVGTSVLAPRCKTRRHLGQAFESVDSNTRAKMAAVVVCCCCEREGIVRGGEGPGGGVALVVCHGVTVVGVHGEEGQEKDEVRGRGKRRSRATQRETLIMDGVWMKVKDSRDDLSQCVCDTCVMKDKTSDSVQACSDLAHVVFVLVGARRVTIVHIRCCCCHALLRCHCCHDFLHQEMFSLHHPWVTVDCVDCHRCNHDKLCIKFLLRFTPQMNSWFTEYTSFPVQSVFNPSLWRSLIIGMPPGVCHCHQDEEEFFHQFWWCALSSGCLSRCNVDSAFLKSGRCLTGIVSEPTKFERIHQLPRYINFLLCGNMTVVFACKSINF